MPSGHGDGRWGAPAALPSSPRTVNGMVVRMACSTCVKYNGSSIQATWAVESEPTPGWAPTETGAMVQAAPLPPRLPPVRRRARSARCLDAL